MCFYKPFVFCTMLLCVWPVIASDIQMRSMISTNYPVAVTTTVRTLVEYILHGTEYRIYLGKNAPRDANAVLSQPLPPQQSNVMMTRMDAILMAIGADSAMVIDHDQQLISFTKGVQRDANN